VLTGQRSDNIPVDPTPEAVAKIDRELGIWVKQHQRVIE